MTKYERALQHLVDYHNSMEDLAETILEILKRDNPEAYQELLDEATAEEE